MNSLKFYAIVLVVFPIYGIQSILYTSPNNVTYYIENGQDYNWYKAHVECSTRDMALVTIESKQTYDDIFALLTKEFATIPSLWVNAVGREQIRVWILTGKPIRPSMLCSGCTSTPGQENCVLAGNVNGLSDDSCLNLKGFICEKRGEDCCKNKPNVVVNLSQKPK